MAVTTRDITIQRLAVETYTIGQGQTTALFNAIYLLYNANPVLLEYAVDEFIPAGVEFVIPPYRTLQIADDEPQFAQAVVTQTAGDENVEQQIIDFVWAWALRNNNERIPGTKLPEQPTAGEINAGTDRDVKSWSVYDVARMITAHASDTSVESLIFVPADAVTVGGNAYRLTPTPAITAYAAGQAFVFTAKTNTGQSNVTVNVSVQGARNLTRKGQPARLERDATYLILFDGSNFRIIASDDSSVEQRVIHPNTDGTFPDAQASDGKLLIVPDDGLYHVRRRSVRTTAPDVTWSTTLPASLNILGAFHRGDRPTPSAANLNRYIYLLNEHIWEKCSFIDSQSIGSFYSWGASEAPDGWVGRFNTEADADTHATKVNDIAFFDGELNVVTAYDATGASDVHIEYYWEAVDTGDENVQADWDETDPEDDAFIRNKPALAPSDAEANVNADWNATSGDAEILNKPDVITSDERTKLGTVESGAQANVNADWDETDDTSDAFIENKPALAPSNAEQNVQSDWTETDANDDAFIKNKPTLAPSNAEQNVQSDWTETDANDDAFIKNKPTIPEAVTSLPYSAITGEKPPADAEANVNADWDATSGDAQILNKPTLAPSDAQPNVNADWDETDSSSDAYIENKPALAPSDAERNVNADWDETDSSSDAYIENKPTLAPSNAEANVQADWEVTDANSDAFIKNKPNVEDGADITDQANVYAQNKEILVEGSNIDITFDDDDETITINASGGDDVTVDRASVYALLKQILVDGSNITTTDNDTAETITVASTATGGASSFSQLTGRASVNQLPSGVSIFPLHLDGGSITWGSSRTYSVRAVVHHNNATYLCIRQHSGSEPGTASDWTTNWVRIGFSNQSPAGSGEENVQSDWDVTNPNSDAFIKNKPTIPARTTSLPYSAITGAKPPVNAEQNVNADWNATSGDAFIANKPTLPPSDAEANVQPDWNEADSSDDAFIRNKPRVEDGADVTDRENVYAQTKAIIREGAHVSIATDDDDETVTISGDDEALVGISESDGVLTGTRAGGTNPVEISLPIGGNVRALGSRFSPATANNGDLQDTGIALPSSPDDDELFLYAAAWGGYSPVFRPLYGSQIKALNTATAGQGETNGTLISTESDSGSQTALYAAKTASGNLLIGNDEGAWTASDYFALYEVLTPTEDMPSRSGFSPQPLSDRAYTWNGTASDNINVLAGSTGSDPLVCPDNGYLLITVHGFVNFEGAVHWRRAADLRASTQSDPLHLRATGGGLSIAPSNIYTNADNEIIFAPNVSGAGSSSDRITIELVSDDEVVGASGYLWYNERNPSTTPAFNLPEVSSNTQIPANDADGYNVTLMTDRSPPLKEGAPLTVDYEGALLYLQGGSGGSSRQNILVELGYQIFPGEQTRQTTQWRQYWQVVQGGRETSIAGDVFSHTQMLQTGVPIPTDAGGNYALTSDDLEAGIPVRILLRIRIYADDNRNNRETGSFTHLEWLQPQVVSYQIGIQRQEQPPREQPYITHFTLTGNTRPQPGTIAGNRYNFDVAAAHSDRVTAARLIGFAGTTPGSSVDALRVFQESEFHEANGAFVLPSSVAALADGESYTVRYEIYGEGQTPGTDDPITYQDRRITAESTVMVRFVRVPQRVGTPAARPDATTLIANMTVMQSMGSAIADWTVSGIPNDGNKWLVGWVVPDNLAQPQHFIVGGINNDAGFAPAFDLTDDGTDYKVYLGYDESYVDDTFNGTTIMVT